MQCNKCQKLKHPMILGNIWLCCGQLHCQHVKKCPSCGSVRPYQLRVTSIESIGDKIPIHGK